MATTVDRHLSGFCKELLGVTPILLIQGAWGVGKTTLAKQLAPRGTVRVTLEDPAQRAFAREEPARFLQQSGESPLIIDEVQLVPELTLEIKAEVDKDRRPGKFILAGSSDLLRTPGLGDSLAGRQDTVTLRPLSVGEKLQLSQEDFVTWILSGAQGPGKPQDPLPLLIEGGFPTPVLRQNQRLKASWMASYMSALSTHDAQELTTGEFSTHLKSLMKYFAANGSSELVRRRLALHLGVSESIVAGYVDLLRRMYLLEELPAWDLSLSSRVVRRSKVALVDTGLSVSLADFTIEKARHVGARELLGSLLEQFVAGELLKQQEWSESRYSVFHFRERAREIDILIELADGRLILLEIKTTVHNPTAQAKHIYAMKERLGDRVVAGAILHAGELAYNLESWLHVLPISSLWNHER